MITATQIPVDPSTVHRLAELRPELVALLMTVAMFLLAHYVAEKQRAKALQQMAQDFHGVTEAHRKALEGLIEDYRQDTAATRDALVSSAQAVGRAAEVIRVHSPGAGPGPGFIGG